mmetsp:Transcript_7860/g.13873  ORF Transcript_7860/g.13873 Transcript_7860/m.13873 type:complete len:1130 (-) Transcript_7860:214-3603(-)
MAGTFGKGRYEGVLYKKPTNFSAYLSLSGWRTRYCVADDTRLRYFSRRGDAVPRGSAEFAGLRVVAKGKVQESMWGFDLVEANGTTLSFASGNAQDVEQWVKVLTQKAKNATNKAKVGNVATPGPQNQGGLATLPGGQGPTGGGKASSVASTNISLERRNGPEMDDFPLSDEDDTDEDSSRVSGALPTFARYGNIPTNFHNVRASLLSSEAARCHDGWELVSLGNGLRLFERPSVYAGNSRSDINGIVRDWTGAVEFKCQASIPGSPSALFAMLMDLSRSRASWDPSFSNADLLDEHDLHNDVVRVNLAPGGPFRWTKARTVELDRYWCREANGVYLVMCTGRDTTQSASAPDGAIGALVDFWHTTITPSRSNRGSCVVTVSLRIDLGGWMQFFKPLARAHVKSIFDSLEALRTLALEKTYSVLKRNAPFPFGCELSDALVTAKVDVNDPEQLVPLLRGLVTSWRVLTPHELSMQRSETHMKQASQRFKASKKDSSECDDPAEPSPLSDLSEQQTDVEKNYTYGMPEGNMMIERRISKDGKTCWKDSGREGGTWSVRGPNYLNDRAKVPSGHTLMEPVQVQWSFSNVPKRNVARDPVGLVQKQHEGRSDRPFLLVVNFMIPSVGNWVIYFAPRQGIEQDPTFNSMLEKFMNASDDKHRNSRLKIIPRVVEGAYLVKRGVGSTPGLIGTKLTTEYYRGDNWYEICIDVSSSRVAASIMSLIKSYASTLVLDIALLIESQAPDELPERLIGSVELRYPVMKSVDLADYATSSEALAKAKEFPPPLKQAQHAQGENQAPNVGGEQGSPSSSAPGSGGDKGKEPGAKDTGAGAGADADADAGREGLGGDHHSDDNTDSGENEGGELNYQYNIPLNNVLAPMALSKEGKSAWSDSGTNAGYWKVRGPNYLSDKVKMLAPVSLMEVVQTQWSFYNSPISHISANPNELIQREHVGRKDRPFLFVINFMVPYLGNWATYFAKRRGEDDDLGADRVLQRFMDGDDEYRNGRFKIIPSVVEGSFLVKKAIGNTPAILSRKLTTSYFRGDNYFEVCIDVGSSSVAEGVLGMVKSYASSLVLDLAFLVESQAADELPERILGSVRLHFPIMSEIPRAQLLSQIYKPEHVSKAEAARSLDG